jgi:UDP-glucose 4-epimerase
MRRDDSTTPTLSKAQLPICIFLPSASRCPNLRAMNILVTGGCGFIGSHVVDALVARGDSVSVLDDLSSGTHDNLNPKATLIEGNVADSALVKSLGAKVDAVIHLAAIASVPICENEPARAHRTNVEGTNAVFAAATMRGIPVIYASSAAVYGDNHNLPLAEAETPKPLGNYGRHKLENEATAARYAGRVPNVGLRFFNVYGPRQDPRSPYSGVISIFAAKAKAGEALTFFGDGDQTRDFIYVGDIVRLILAALDHAKGVMVLNGCTGRATSLKQLATTIGEALGKPIHTRQEAAREGDIRHSLGNPTLSTQALGFVAETSLAEGLKALVVHG